MVERTPAFVSRHDCRDGRHERESTLRAVSSARNLGRVDKFGMIGVARQAKADHTLVFDTRTRAWLRFSSDPLH
jgi:hypothetical protein